MSNKKKILVFIYLSFFCFFMQAYAMENLFYMLRDDVGDSIHDKASGFESVKAHHKKITILVPQAYQIDSNGVVWGSVDKRIIDFAAANKIKLMPLITNVDFSKAVIHNFLNDPKAQARAVLDILKACQNNHYYGVQFDFESVGIDDKDALSNFLQFAGDVLHKNGFLMSATVIPNLTTEPTTSDFLRLRYENWVGGYDYKAMAKSCDFITLMAYDQHGEGTTPGPVASLPWVEDIVKYALQQIPAQKISLGIPTYSDFWYTAGNDEDRDVHARIDQISFSDVTGLLKKYNAKLQWDKQQQVPFTFYSHNWLNEYIFAENEQSFKLKYELAKKYHLRGVSVWRLGMEDPGIWKIVNGFL